MKKYWVYDGLKDEVSKLTIEQIKLYIDGGNPLIIIDNEKHLKKWVELIKKERYKNITCTHEHRIEVKYRCADCGTVI